MQEDRQQGQRRSVLGTEQVTVSAHLKQKPQISKRACTKSALSHSGYSV